MVSSRLAQPRFGVQHKTRRTDATKQKTVKRRIAKIEIKKAKKKPARLMAAGKSNSRRVGGDRNYCIESGVINLLYFHNNCHFIFQ